MNEATIKLMEALKSGITKVEGAVQTNEDGEKYRYDEYKNKFKSTPYFLETLFNNAAKAAGAEFRTTFHDGNLTFSFARAKYKGVKHGNIQYNELVIIK